MSSGCVVFKSLCSKNGAWYCQIKSTINTGCRRRHEGMSSWKSFSPIFLIITCVVMQRLQLFVWTSKAFLLDMQPYLIPNLKWMGSTMLIISGLSIRISSLQNFLCFLLDVVDLILKLQCFFNFSSVRVAVVRLCRWTNQSSQWALTVQIHSRSQMDSFP